MQGDQYSERYVFAVYSPPELTEPTTALASFQSDKRTLCYCVLEHGSTGDHPHLNLIYNTTSRPCEQREWMYRQLGIPRKEIPQQRYLVHCKNVSDLAMLVCGYLTKEEDAEVIYCHDDFSVASLSDQYKASKKVFRTTSTQKRLLTCVSEVQVFEQALRYFESRELSDFEFRRFQKQWVDSLHYCKRMSWTKLHNWLRLYYSEDATLPDSGSYPLIFDI